MKNGFKCLLLLVACTGLMQAQQVVNLGKTPWKFAKVEPKINNITPELIAFNKAEEYTKLFDGKNETSYNLDRNHSPILIDLGKPRLLSRLKIKFNQGIKVVGYKIEGSVDRGSSWTVLTDYLKDPQTCLFERHEEMGTIGSTVGYIQRIDGAYINPSISGLYQYLRLTVIQDKDKQAQMEPLGIKGIDVFVEDGQPENDYKKITALDFDDHAWKTVGLPHCFNDSDSYLNHPSAPIWKGSVWYRSKFKLNGKDKNKRFYLEFKAIGIAASVYVNGHFMPGNTAVPQPGAVTHIGCFIPFIVDITNQVVFDRENILSVQISNASNSFFTWPNFGVWEAFGMGWGGIYSDVNLLIENEIHIPGNAFSASNEWGTYNAVKEADEQQAQLVFQTNIKNTGKKDKQLTLAIQLLDAKGKIVQTVRSVVASIHGATKFVENGMSINKPTLWYPNNSEYGKPYLYTVRRILSEGKRVLDQKEEVLGIRTIRWDDDYCYVNGKKQILQGFGHRNMYPALGCAIPEELQWKDIAYIAQCGGNTLRIGHTPPLPGFIEACDEYGIMLILNSGDNEWALKDEPANTYKREYDRNAILAFRNHPSVIVWESNNGLAKDGAIYYPSYTFEIAKKYDPINTRIILNRDWYPPEWDKKNRVLVGFTNGFTKINGSPSLNAEVYGANWEGRASWNIARFDYENEKRFTQWYVDNYLADLTNKACGWLDWMLAETQGESYTIYLNGKANQKSLGSCAMDANRIPKLKYRVFEKALWIPFETKPGVTLQSTWDFDYPVQNIDVWSNCPYVEVLVNNRSYGIKENGLKTKRLTWENLVWKKGCVLARGLDKDRKVCCNDTLYSSEAPYSIQLVLEPLLVKPDGGMFSRKANGSDVAIITAKVV
ncbi:MAG: glycoside hydrolase family 2 TIM barrel-domain containing protein, partial [Bacteroidota bacterium]|nr:glycoside hydrolase family 2 TIM barrel-domain containing protein [Bacteroidota bacterium]